jgi:hypothetical protein
LRVNPSRHKEFSSVWLRLLALAFEKVRTNKHLFDLLVFQELLKFTGEKDLDGAFRQPLLKNHDDEKSTPRIYHIELDSFVHRKVLPLTSGARPEASIFILSGERRRQEWQATVLFLPRGGRHANLASL